MFLPRIYPITDTEISTLSHCEQTIKLIEGGATLIQLREKNASPIDFYKSAKEAIRISKNTKTKIIINDRVDLAMAINADGVHLGQNDLPPKKARELLGEDAVIGFSTHNEKQAMAALDLPIDYIAIGPIFKTETKKDADKTLGIEGLKRIRKAIGDFPLVAIGGINYKNFQQVLDAGANSVAIINGILSEPTRIAENTRKYLLSAE